MAGGGLRVDLGEAGADGGAEDELDKAQDEDGEVRPRAEPVCVCVCGWGGGTRQPCEVKAAVSQAGPPSCLSGWETGPPPARRAKALSRCKAGAEKGGT